MRKIGDEAAEAATKIFNMVSGINNIKAGEAKYQTRTKAVQTITNATGKTVAEVEEILDRLQKYTDETSADFTEMVNSIGKFTSVGVELSVAEKAMEGISNEAYKSGASRMEAGRAMYNFAQALSSGAVKLIDWKSIENANMATKEFKEELIKTAIELGTIEKKTETTGKIMKQTKKATKTAAAEFKETEINYKSFNQTLSEGWLTSDVLIKTLNRYADTNTEIGKSAFAAAKEYLTFGDVVDTIADTVSSGWMRTWQAIFGNLDEARKLWTRVGDSIVDLYSVFSEYRVSLVESWHELGGYTAAIEAASNIWHTFANIVLGVKEAFEQIIPPMTAERLVTITEKIKDASAKLRKMFGLYKESEEEIEETTSESAKATASTKKTTDQAKKLAGETKTIAKNLDEIKAGLKSGSVGDSVKKLQKQLNKLGITSQKLAVDGIFGKKTQEAVGALQKELGVAQTGIWDETTKAAAATSSELAGIKDTAESSTVDLSKTLGLGSRGNAVKNLQKQLNKFGVQADKLVADGIFGPKTQAAVKALQKELGVKQTGTWDKATMEAVSTSEKYSDSATTISTKAKEATEETKEAVEETSPLMERLQNIVRGWASAVGISFELLKSLGATIKNIAKMFIPLINVGLRFVSMLAEMVQNLNSNLKQGNKYSQLTKSITNFFKPLGDLIKNIAKSIDKFITLYAQFLKVTGNTNTFGSFFTFLEMYIRKNTPFGFIFDLANAAIAGIIKIRDTIKKVVELAAEKIGVIGKELGSVKSLDQFLYLVESHMQNLPFIGKLIKGFDGKGLIKLKNILISFVVSVVAAFQNKSFKPILMFFQALKESFKNAIKGTPIETVIKFIETKSKIVKNILLTLAATVVKVAGIIGSGVKKFIDTWGWVSNLDEVLFMVEYFLSKIPLIGLLFRNADGSFSGNTLINIKNAIVTFVTGIVKVFRDGDFSVIKNFFATLWGSFKEAVTNSPFGSFLRGVMEFGEKIIAVLIKMASMIASIVGSVVKRVKAFVNEWNWISSFDELLFVIEYFLSKLPIVGALFRDAEGSFNGDILINIKNRISEFVSGITQTFKDGDTSSITNFVTNLYDNLKEAAKTNPFIDYLLSIGELIKEIITAIDSLVSTVISGGKGSANRVNKSGVGSLLDNLIIMFTNFNRFVTSVIKDLNQSGTLSAIGNVIISIFRLVSVLGEMIFNEINNILGIASGTEVKSGLQGFLEKVAAFARSFANAINTFVNSYERFLSETGKTNTFSSFFEFLTQYFSGATGVIGSLISKILPIVKAFINSIRNMVGKILESFDGKTINTIGDFFSALWDGIKNAIPFIGELANTVGPLVSKVAKWIGSFVKEILGLFEGHEINSIADVFIIIIDAIKKGILSVITWLGSLKDTIAEALQLLTEKGIEAFLDKLYEIFIEKNPIVNLFDQILSFFESIPERSENVKNKIVNAVNSVAAIPGDVSENITTNTSNIFDNLGKTIQTIFNRIIMVGLGLAVPTLIGAITATAYNFSSAVAMFGKGWVAEKIKKTGVKFDTIGDTALKIVGAITVLTILFWRLGEMKKENIENAQLALWNIAGVIGGLIAVLSLLQSKLGGIGNMGYQVLAITGSLAALAIGLYLLVNVWKFASTSENLPHLISSIFVMIALIAAFGALELGLAKIASTNGGKAKVKIDAIFDMCKGIALVIAAFGALVFMIAQANKVDENGKSSKEAVEQAFGMMTGILLYFGVLIGALAYVASKSPKGAVVVNIKGLLPIAGSMLMLIIALGEVALAIYFLGPGAVWQAFAMIEGLLVTLGVIIHQIYKLTKDDDPKDVKKRVGALTLSMVAMVISLGLVAWEIAMLSTQLQSIPMGNLITEMAGLLTIVSVMGAITLLFQKHGGGNKEAYAKVGALALSMVSVAIAVGIVAYFLAQSAQMLRLVPLEQMITYVAGVLLIIAAMGAIAIAMQKFGNKGLDAISNAGGLFIAMIGMAVALGIVATVMSESAKNVANVPLGNLITFMAGMIILLGVMSFAVYMLKDIKIDSFINFAIGFAAVLLGIGLGVALFGTLVSGTINIASQALWLLGSRFNQFAKMIEEVNWEPVNKLYTFFTQDIIIIWNMIKDIDFNSFNDKIEKLVHIAGLLAVFSENVESITDETKAATDRIPGLMSSVSDATTAAKDISIPDFIANGNLTELGASIANYGDLITATTATEESSAFAKTLVEDAVSIAGSVAGITDPDKVSSTLTNLGSAIDLYYGFLNGIVTDEDGNVQIPTVDSQMISQAFNALAEAIPSDKIDMLTSYAEGSDNDMSKVALGINALGQALGSYATDIGGLKDAPVSEANGVLDTFSKLSSSINPKDILGRIVNTSNQRSFSDFADDIRALGGALRVYAFNIGGLTKKKVENANGVLDMFMKLEKQFHDENNDFKWTNLFKIFQGEQTNLTKFSGQIKNVSGALKLYAEDIGALENAPVSKANKVITDILRVASKLNSIGPTGGAFSWLFGDTSLSTFATNMGDLGNGVKQFVMALKDENLNNINMDNVPQATQFVNDLIDNMSKIESTSLVGKLFTGEKSFENVGKGLGALGEQIGKFYGWTKEVDYDKMPDVFQIVERILGWTDILQKDAITVFDNDAGFGGLGADVDIFTYIADKIPKVLASITDLDRVIDEDGTTLIQSLKEFGKKITEAIMEGISNPGKESNAETAVNTVMGMIKTKVESFYTNFYEAGKYVIQGFIDGLQNKDMLNKLIEAGIVVGVTPTEATQKEVQVQSPSKKFEWIGHMCALGLKNGFEKYGYLVTDSTLDLASSSLEAIMATYDATKLGDVSQAAVETMKNALVKPVEQYSKQDKEMLKDMLVMSGYLAEADRKTEKKVNAAIKKFKKEVIYDKDYTGKIDDSWGISDAVKLIDVIRKQMNDDGSYDSLKYEQELVAALGNEYEKTGEKAEKANEKSTSSNNKSAATNKAALTDTERFIKNLKKNYGDLGDALDYINTTIYGGDGKTNVDWKVLRNIVTAGGGAISHSGIINFKSKAMKDQYTGDIIDDTWLRSDTEKLRNIISDAYLNELTVGNVTLNKRKIVTAKQMQEAGWKDFKDNYTTLFNDIAYAEIDDKNVLLTLTPILPNGEILSPESLNDYADALFAAQMKDKNGAINADKIENGGLGILLRFNETTKSASKALDAAQKYSDKLDKYQDRVYNDTGRWVSMQEMLEERGYLRSGKYKRGSRDVATQVALREFKKDIYGSIGGSALRDWTSQDQKRLDATVEKFGSLDQLFIERIGATKKPTKYLKTIDKKINEEKKRQSKEQKNRSDVQNMLIKYGYLAYDANFKKGSFDETTSAALKKFNKEILGITSDSVWINDEWRDTLNDQAKAFGSLQKAVEAKASDDVKAQAIENNKTPEERKKEQRDAELAAQGKVDNRGFIVDKEYDPTQIQSKEENRKLWKTRDIYGMTLTKGNAGEIVGELQKALISKGYLTNADYTEVYDEKTVEAIKKLQEDLHIDQTGAWDDDTIERTKARKALGVVQDKQGYEVLPLFSNEVYYGAREGKNGMPKNRVKNLQKRLIKYGYLAEGEADGIYGKKTADAMRKLQAELNVAQTGNWDWNTIAAARRSGKFGTGIKVTGEIEVSGGSATSGISSAFNSSEWMGSLTENLNPSSLFSGLTGSDATKSISDAVSSLMGDPNDTDGSGGGLFGGIFSKIKEGASNLPEFLTGMLDLPTDNMLDIFKSGDDTGGSFLDGILTKIKGGVGDFGSGILSFFGLGEGGEGVTDAGVKQALSTASDALGGDALGGILEKIKGGASDLGGSLLSLFGLGEDGAVSNEAITGALSTAGGALGSGLLGAIASKIGEGGSKIVEAILGALGLDKKDTKNVQAVVNAVGGAIGTSGEDSGGSTSSVRPVIDADSYASAVAPKLSAEFNKETSPIYKIGTSLTSVQAIAGKMNTAMETMDTNMQTKFDALAAKFDGINTHMDNIHKDIANMKIVLDSGQLVVGTVDAMDRALGRKHFVAGGFRNTTK